MASHVGVLPFSPSPTQLPNGSTTTARFRPSSGLLTWSERSDHSLDGRRLTKWMTMATNVRRSEYVGNEKRSGKACLWSLHGGEMKTARSHGIIGPQTSATLNLWRFRCST